MKIKRTTIVGMAALLVLVSVVFTVLAGNPPGPGTPPEDTKSYTLEDIYQRFESGAAGVPGVFAGPGAGVAPGVGTGHTLNETMALAPQVDNTNGVTTTEVAAGKTFWGLNEAEGEWGLQTGTATGECCTCSGTLNGTRWCDNEDGTVTDLTTCLVWLKKADWGGQKPWDDCTTHDDAFTRAGLLANGATGADLSDGSAAGAWRLPTKTELVGITIGDEAVNSSNMRAFTGVQSYRWWSSSTYAGDAGDAWYVGLGDGGVGANGKASTNYVWPVRGGQ
jgi:hypothetical protein